MQTAEPGAHADAFRPDVEGLRGVAILLVLLFHAGLPLPGGFVGVDVFFVISGFLITGLLLRERDRTGRISFTRFYARRVRRLLPAAAVVLAVTLPLAYLVVAPLDRSSVMLDGAASALSVGNIRFALTTGDYFTSMTTPSPFLHFWSLGVEEQFYLVWPALLLLAAWRLPRTGAALALGVVLVASFAASVLVTDVSPSWAFYMLPTRAWQLAAGGLLAVGAERVARAPAPILAPLGWVAVGLLTLATLVLNSDVAYPGFAALAPAAAAAALVASGSLRWGPGLLLRTAPLRFLGRISYSLYLWHWPILVLVPLALGGTLETPAMLALAFLAIAAATASWAFVEEPFRRGAPALAAPPRRTIALGLAAMLTVVVMASTLDRTVNAELDALSVSSSEVTVDDPWLATPGPEEAAAGDPWTAADTTTANPASTDPPTATPASTDPPPASAWPGPSAAVGVTPHAATGPAPAADPASSSVAPGGAPASASTPAPVVPAAPAQPASYALPPEVAPPLARARYDEERLWKDRCLAIEGVTSPPDCVYGNPGGTFTVALVGDSHASMWFPAVEAVATRHGWRLMTFVKVACPFIDMRVRNINLKREYRECQTWNNAVVARLASLKPDLVLVSMSRWIFPVLSVDGSTARQGAAMARMLRRIAGPVALIAGIPMPTVDVPVCLSANLGDIRRCATPRSQAYRSDMLVRERQATRATGDLLVDMTAAVCPSDPCPAVVNGKIVYRDGHHLTATFARSLAPALDRALAPLVPSLPVPSR